MPQYGVLFALTASMASIAFIVSFAFFISLHLAAHSVKGCIHTRKGLYTYVRFRSFLNTASS